MTTATAGNASRPTHLLSIAGTPERVAVEPGETLLKASLRQGLRIPHLCLVGDCGSCRCRLVSGEVRLKKDISGHIDLHGLAAGQLLACQALAESDVELEVPGLSPAPDGGQAPVCSMSARIARVEAMNHDICQLVLELEAPLDYRAGQYAQLTVPGHEALADEPRCYSFAQSPALRTGQEVCFHVRRVPGGAFTQWLFASNRSGHVLSLSGPYGDFAHSGDMARPMVCVAGGSGLAPIKALIEDLAARPEAPDLTLFFGARTQADLYCLQEIDALLSRWRGRFIFVPVLSMEPAGSGWSGLTGYCGEHLDKFCDLHASDFYLCGPPPMVDALLARLQGETDLRHIHFDRFLDRSNFNPKETSQ